jgi:hypothetical protein
MDVNGAIIERLREIGARAGKLVVMYEIGVPLIAAGHDQHEIVNALYRLQKDKMIELLSSNGLRLLKEF